MISKEQYQRFLGSGQRVTDWCREMGIDRGHLYRTVRKYGWGVPKAPKSMNEPAIRMRKLRERRKGEVS